MKNSSLKIGALIIAAIIFISFAFYIVNPIENPETTTTTTTITTITNTTTLTTTLTNYTINTITTTTIQKTNPELATKLEALILIEDALARENPYKEKEYWKFEEERWDYILTASNSTIAKEIISVLEEINEHLAEGGEGIPYILWERQTLLTSEFWGWYKIEYQETMAEIIEIVRG
jgi:hypothetical protein|tara:strand:- start:527 stop:1057 length:531 start_codon:yes stop_codon:yes gene_type:complete